MLILDYTESKYLEVDNQTYYFSNFSAFLKPFTCSNKFIYNELPHLLNKFRKSSKNVIKLVDDAIWKGNLYQECYYWI